MSLKVKDNVELSCCEEEDVKQIGIGVVYEINGCHEVKLLNFISEFLFVDVYVKDDKFDSQSFVIDTKMQIP